MGFLRIDAAVPSASPFSSPLASISSFPSPTTLSSMSTSSAAASKPRELAPFLKLLREMLDAEPSSVLRWTPDGRAFEILDLHEMTYTVLPKYFKHRKYASFQRQLNYFHFRKWTKSRSPLCTFANPFFLRDAPELTWHIVRKRDLTSKAKTKRPRAQSLEPKGDSTTLTNSPSIHPGASPSLNPKPSERMQAPKPKPRPTRGRAASASAAVGDPQRPQSQDSQTQGLLQWIDAQFPSIASIELLDGA